MANIETVRAYCLAKPSTSEGFPFDEETLVFKVMDKMFAVCTLEDPDWFVLKCDPERAIELREQYACIEGAYHFNKKYWNQHRLSQLDDALIYELIDHSYDEVVKKMTKKMRAELAAMSNSQE